MKRLAAMLIIAAFFIAGNVSSVFASHGKWIWKSAYTYKQSPATGRTMKLVTGVWIYKYYSNNRWRFTVGPSIPGQGTYMRFETDGNTIYVEAFNALWRYVGYWVWWTVDWQGPTKSYTSNWINWQHMGDPYKVYDEGNSLRIETYFTINDGRSWKTSVWRDIALSRNMTSDPWY